MNRNFRGIVLILAISTLIGLAVGVAVPLVMPAIMYAKTVPLSAETESSMLAFTGVCLALMFTLGNATMGAAVHLLSFPRRTKAFLIGTFLFSLGSMVFLAASYMLAKYTGERLEVVLSPGWIFEHFPLVIHMVIIPLVPELSLVAGIVVFAKMRAQKQAENAVMQTAKTTGGGGELIIQALKESGEPLSIGELQQATELSQWQVDNRTKKLLKAELISLVGGRPKRYRLAEKKE